MVINEALMYTENPWNVSKRKKDTHDTQNKQSEICTAIAQDTQAQELGNHRQISVEKAPASPWCEEQRLSAGSGVMGWPAEQTPTQLVNTLNYIETTHSCF